MGVVVDRIKHWAAPHVRRMSVPLIRAVVPELKMRYGSLAARSRCGILFAASVGTHGARDGRLPRPTP